MHRTSVIGDGADQSLHAVADHRAVSRSAAGEPSVILQFQKPAVAAASMALEDASSSDWDVPPTIGEPAIKLVADWKLPKIVCWRGSYEEG